MVDPISLVIRIVFSLGVIMVVVYGAIAIIVFWRFSLSRLLPLVLTISYIFVSLLILGHSLTVLNRF